MIEDKNIVIWDQESENQDQEVTNCQTMEVGQGLF